MVSFFLISRVIFTILTKAIHKLNQKYLDHKDTCWFREKILSGRRKNKFNWPSKHHWPCSWWPRHTYIHSLALLSYWEKNTGNLQGRDDRDILQECSCSVCAPKKIIKISVFFIKYNKEDLISDYYQCTPFFCWNQNLCIATDV